MFAQESVMDIQKEKIAHEKHLLSQGVDFKYLPNIQYSELENVYELIEWDEEYSEALNEINSSWCTWQAAKAQAVPEGFVLVLKEIPKSFDEGLYFYSNSISVVNEHSDGFIPMSDIDHSEIWKLVIEAQEPTND